MIESNREKAFRWMESVWNQHQLDVIDEMIAPDCIGHHEGCETHGPKGVRSYISSIQAAFPDLRVIVEHAIEEGDHVAVRWTAHGTHLGDGLGVPATGAEVEFHGMTWMTFDENGQLVEGWDAWNQGSLMHHLAQAALLR